MNYALVGHGKMGRAIDAAAAARGHRRRIVVDRGGKITAARFRGVDVAFEFTEPAAARANVLALLAHGIFVVCGTTGWDASDPEIRKAARRAKAGAVIAPNFSVGMNLFYALLEDAARSYLAVGGYDPWIAEWHHRAKRDVPSGTARRLGAIVRTAAPDGDGAGEIAIASVRAGHEPGRHVVGFDGPHDAVILSHAARGREGFAEGAVLAGEWIVKRRGIHAFSDVLDDLVGRQRGGR
jgi:4-hydroxy-tetrahydrodipicolinate reductase